MNERRRRIAADPARTPRNGHEHDHPARQQISRCWPRTRPRSGSWCWQTGSTGRTSGTPCRCPATPGGTGSASTRFPSFPREQTSATRPRSPSMPTASSTTCSSGWRGRTTSQWACFSRPRMTGPKRSPRCDRFSELSAPFRPRTGRHLQHAAWPGRILRRGPRAGTLRPRLLRRRGRETHAERGMVSEFRVR